MSTLTSSSANCSTVKSKVNCGQQGSCETQTPCCPSCGAVECLCRPRFFAGMLLSEQDLNRLDQYIKNKNRLHTRNLHGWGVVNGMKVLCDPCGSVKVTEGYAVSPCGDDIVVCEATSVNICELISQCKRGPNTPNCEPFRKPANTHCQDLEEEWVLTIEYQEWMSRGVTALRGSSCKTGRCGSGGCSCGGNGANSCSCGGSKSAGSASCGCGGSAGSSLSTKSNAGKSNRGSPPQCEPTVVCEGFSFGVYPKPDEDPKSDDDDNKLFNTNGSFAEIFACCADGLIATLPPMPDLKNDNVAELASQASVWCCRFRANMIAYYLKNPSTSCEIIEFLENIRCPNVNDGDQFAKEWILAFLNLIAAWFEGIKNCLCLALLPPTPQTTCDTRVPLATVKIRARDCKILSICNWTTERQMMVTWPAMGHWLGIISIGDFLRNLLDKICCSSLLGLFDNVFDDPKYENNPGDSVPGTVPGSVPMTGNFAIMSGNNGNNGPANDATETNTHKPSEPLSFAKILNLASGEITAQFGSRLGLSDIAANTEKFSRIIEGVIGRQNQPLELGALLNGVSPRFKLPSNAQKLNPVESQNIPLVMMTEIVARPLLSQFLGEKEATQQIYELQRNLRRAASASSDNKAPVSTDDEMRKHMQELQTRLDEQNQMLGVLRTQLTERG